ncbi:MAG TPA: glycine cleavage system protein GcvH [Desulfomonilaceae bacterium]|nr:glycine cleavage system protein GcvH [Desulfomonilaceae bacterium]
MEYAGYVFPDDLKYERNHFWAKIEGDLVVTGASEFISKQAGEITFVDLPEEGDELTCGKPYGSIESGKWVGRIYAVVSGEIAEVNEVLEDEPEKMNEDPYGAAWICKIRPSNLEAEMATLMSPDENYKKFISEEIDKIEKQKK